ATRFKTPRRIPSYCGQRAKHRTVASIMNTSLPEEKMERTPTMMGIFAHPDDEVLGCGGTLAQLAKAGVSISLICATRGEAGEIASPELATADILGNVREEEMLCSAEALGVAEVHFLGYRDSGMAGTPENENPEAFIN